MTFNASTYANFVSAASAAQERLFLQYIGPRERLRHHHRRLGHRRRRARGRPCRASRASASASSCSRPARSSIPRTSTTSAAFRTRAWRSISAATRSGRAGTRARRTSSASKPQLNFGGRSIFWSGLIPSIQGWELEFFPPRVRQDLESGLLNRAGETMNESRSMGATAQAIVTKLRQTPARQRLLDPGNAARAAPALPGARRHAQGPVLHRADRRVQHRRAARQPGRADARA